MLRGKCLHYVCVLIYKIICAAATNHDPHVLLYMLRYIYIYVCVCMHVCMYCACVAATRESSM